MQLNLPDLKPPERHAGGSLSPKGYHKPDVMRLFGSGDDLDRLLERCRRSDAEAWSQLVERFRGLVYSVPKRMGMGEDDAADVFQHTFQALYTNLDRIDNPQYLPRWLAVTASRESLRLKRIHAKVPVGGDAMDLEQLVADEERTAEQTSIASAEAHEVRQGLQELPDRCRTLLTLLFDDDSIPYQEISEKAGIPIGAIGPTRARCLAKLREILLKRGFFE
jgi:RNA polymerase sigma factor (sigma-70 family)